MVFRDLHAFARKFESPLGHPTQVSAQVQLVATCDYLRVRPRVQLRWLALTLVEIKFASTQDNASCSLFGRPQPESTRVEWRPFVIISNNLLANQIKDTSAYSDLRGNLRARLATQCKLLRKFDLWLLGVQLFYQGLGFIKSREKERSQNFPCYLRRWVPQSTKTERLARGLTKSSCFQFRDIFPALSRINFLLLIDVSSYFWVQQGVCSLWLYGSGQQGTAWVNSLFITIISCVRRYGVLVTTFWSVKITMLSRATFLVSNGNNIVVCNFELFAANDVLWRNKDHHHHHQRPTNCHWKRSQFLVTTIQVEL